MSPLWQRPGRHWALGTEVWPSLEGTTRIGDRDIPYKLGPTKSNDLYTRGESIKITELSLPKRIPLLKEGSNEPMADNRGFFPQGFSPIALPPSKRGTKQAYGWQQGFFPTGFFPKVSIYISYLYHVYCAYRSFCLSDQVPMTGTQLSLKKAKPRHCMYSCAIYL